MELIKGNGMSSGHGMFEKVTDAHVVIIVKGTYSVVPLYQRSGRLFALTNEGFVQLDEGGRTSRQVGARPVRWDEIINCKAKPDSLGHMVML